MYVEFRGEQVNSEAVFKDFIVAMAKKYEVGTLWVIFSHVRKFLRLEEGMDIGRTQVVRDFLRTIEKKAEPTAKAAAFALADVERFLREGTEDMLLQKTVMALGCYAGLRCDEIVHLDFGDVETVAGGVMVHVQRSKTDQRGRGEGIMIAAGRDEAICPVRAIQRYLGERGDKSGRLLLQKRSGKFTEQPVGKCAVSKVPLFVATWLGLENAAEFRGHSMRATMATAMAEAGATSIELAQHGRWASSGIAESYVRESKRSKIAIARKLVRVDGDADVAGAPGGGGVMFQNCAIEKVEVLVKRRDED
jgi:integrase